MAVLDVSATTTGLGDPPARRLPQILRGRVLLPVSVVLAALSLIATRSPTFDVWAWLVYGREIAHLDLNTHYGPAFKPLPVAVSTVSSVFGDLAVPIWMIIARAAGLLALAGIARVTWRAYGAVAAGIATVALVTVHLFAVYMVPYGMSEPMLAACVLWAVDRHCEGRRGQAYLLVFAAALLRIEVWPFLLLYAVFLFRRRQVQPTLLVAGLLLVPAAWFLPEWWGSGNPLRPGNGRSVPGDPSTQAHPGLAVITTVGEDLVAWVWGGALLGLAWAVWVRDRFLLALAALGAAWLALEAVMAESGLSSGVSRYLIVTHAVACVFAGVGWVALVRLVRQRFPASGAAQYVAVAAVALLAIPSALTYENWLYRGAKDVRFQQRNYEAIAKAVDAAGGPDVINRCSPLVWTRDYRETQVGWLLHRHLIDVPVASALVPGRPVSDYVSPMVQVVDRFGQPLLPAPIDFLHYRTLGEATVDGVPARVISPC
jgi:hypothetical protein